MSESITRPTAPYRAGHPNHRAFFGTFAAAHAHASTCCIRATEGHVRVDRKAGKIYRTMSVAAITAAATATAPEVDRVAKVGAPATFSIGSDSYSVEVIEVSPSGHKVTTRAMSTRCTDYERQTYEIASNPYGSVRTFTRRKGGTDDRPIYLLAGSNYGYLFVGFAREYRDPSF